MNNTPCICHDWPNANPVIKILTTHHDACKKAQKLDIALVGLIKDLLDVNNPDPKTGRAIRQQNAFKATQKAHAVVEYYHLKH